MVAKIFQKGLVMLHRILLFAKMHVYGAMLCMMCWSLQPLSLAMLFLIDDFTIGRLVTNTYIYITSFTAVEPIPSHKVMQHFDLIHIQFYLHITERCLIRHVRVIMAGVPFLQNVAEYNDNVSDHVEILENPIKPKQSLPE